MPSYSVTLERRWPGQIERKCETCQITFFTHRSKTGKFCGRPCASVAHSERMRARRVPRTDPQVCSKCRQSFPLASYPKDRLGAPALRCRECAQGSPEAKRRHHLISKFGITLEAWLEMYRAQGGRCPVCWTDLPVIETMMTAMARTESWSPRNWNTDHDHLTGKVRGILCRLCNVGLGSFKENPFVMQRAVAYLLEHASTSLLPAREDDALEVS